MSFILDENQQQHLLVILNDINRHIFEVNSAATGAANGSPKAKLGGRKRPSIEQQLPDLITGFNHTNRHHLANFVLNTNQFFKTFFRFTSSLIGNDNQNPHLPPPPPASSPSKGKSVLAWLGRFYNKILFEHLDFERIFDAPPPPESSEQSGGAGTGGVIPSKKDHLLAKSKQLVNGGNQATAPSSAGANHNGAPPGGNVQVGASAGSGSGSSQQPGSSTGNSSNNNGGGSSLKEEPPPPPQHQQQHQQLDLLGRAVHHLHELPGTAQQQQQIYMAHLANDQQTGGGTNASPHHNQHQQQQQDHHSLELFNAHQQALDQQQLQHQQYQSTILSTILKDLTFLILLIIYLFYKLRHIFPTLINRFEVSWKFFGAFERELDPSFQYDNLMEFLQLELAQQKRANERRSDALRQEVAQLEKISKIVEKEIESEISRVIQLQSRAQVKTTGGGGASAGTISSGTSIRQIATSSTGTISLADLKGLKLSSPGSSSSTGPITVPLGIVTGSASTGGSGTSSGRACPECGKSFRNTYKLNRHLYVHKDPSEKPYVCDWTGCTYRSISRNDLNRHKMIHTGEKPYLCEIEGCEKRYSRPDKLRHHKQTVHFKDGGGGGGGAVAKKEQICIYPGCNFQCATKSELNRHQLVHEKDDKLLKQVVQVQQQQQQQVQQQHVQQQRKETDTYVTLPISAAAQDIASVIAASGQATHHLQQQQQQTVHAHQQQQQQHHLVQAQQQQAQQQQHLSMPLSMLTNHASVNQLIQHHPALNISGLSAETRLAVAAAAAAQQQQSQVQASTAAAHHLSNEQQQPGGGGTQVVVVPSIGAAGGGANIGHNQISTIASIPISAVVSSINSNGGGVAVSGVVQAQAVNGQQQQQQQQQQRLNTISVWSS